MRSIGVLSASAIALAERDQNKYKFTRTVPLADQPARCWSALCYCCGAPSYTRMFMPERARQHSSARRSLCSAGVERVRPVPVPSRASCYQTPSEMANDSRAQAGTPRRENEAASSPTIHSPHIFRAGACVRRPAKSQGGREPGGERGSAGKEGVLLRLNLRQVH